MASLPTIPDVCRVAIKGLTPAGTPWVNTFHFRDESNDMPAAIALVAVDVAALFSNAGIAGAPGWANHADAQASTSEVVFTPLDNASASSVFTMAISGTGAASPDALPPDTAIVVTLRTAKRGPRHRGRMYLAGFNEAANDANGRVTTTYVTGLALVFNNFITAMELQGTQMVVASYKFSTAETVIQASVNNVFDRQRRRRT